MGFPASRSLALYVFLVIFGTSRAVKIELTWEKPIPLLSELKLLLSWHQMLWKCGCLGTDTPLNSKLLEIPNFFSFITLTKENGPAKRYKSYYH